MRLARFFPLLAAHLIPALAVGAQSPDFTSRVDAQTLAVIQPLLEEAARDSLPVDALRAKVLEGVAKGVSASVIGQAVSDLAGEFRVARAGLKGRLPSAVLADGEVVAAAMASRHGLSLDDLQAVWESRPDGGSLEVPVTVLGELVRRGVPVREATELMSYVVQERVSLHLAAQIPGRFDGAMGTGLPAVAALTEALRVLNIPNPSGRRPPG
jgi:hypothetical protein